MLKTGLWAALGILVSASVNAQSLKTEDEKTIYAVGLLLGQNAAIFGFTKAELEPFKKGIMDGATGAKPQVNLEEYREKVDAFHKKRSAAKAEAEKSKMQPFLDKAAAEKGAVKTSSGMIYKDLTEGTGPSPKETDTVKVNYKGTLTNGTEFDSSFKRGQPAEFRLNQVIPCWTEGLQKMKVGGKAKLVCPSSIAYKDQGRPPTIPGGAALVFEVDLLEILAPKTPGAMTRGDGGTVILHKGVLHTFDGGAGSSKK
jgi:FKBP-type peptidyl-prolyl cis-trans isomerase FkpA